MRQTAKQAKVYQAPTIKVVEFMIELGAGASGFTEREEETGKYDLIGDPEDQSTQRESWGTFN